MPPRFERARELPITAERLERRLGMLGPEDAATARLALDFLTWQRQPADRSDAEVVARYRRIMAEVEAPTLRAMIESRMTLRTVMAALRRRRAGLPPPGRGEPWGVGPYAGRIERHWSDPDLGLRHVLTWLPEARRLFEAGDALGLQLLLMGVVWNHLTRLGEATGPFTFEAVLVYLFKWDLLARRLTYAAPAAVRRFERLVAETTRDHAELFAG